MRADPSPDHAAEGTARVIPTIDVAPYRSGFASIVGHGIAPSTIAGAFDAGRRFFTLPDAYKRSIREQRSNRGYQPMYDNVRGDGKPSAQEGYTIGHPQAPTDPALRAMPFHAATPWPPLDDFREPLESLYRALYDLGRTLLGALARHLDASAAAPARRRPPPPPAPPRGRRVRARDGRWIPVVPNPAAVVVNVGKMLRHWSGGRYNAALHRVVNRSGRDRYSIPLFVHPAYHTVVDPRDLVGTRADGAAYPPLVAGETVNASFATTRKSWNDPPAAAPTSGCGRPPGVVRPLSRPRHARRPRCGPRPPYRAALIGKPMPVPSHRGALAAVAALLASSASPAFAIDLPAERTSTCDVSTTGGDYRALSCRWPAGARASTLRFTARFAGGHDDTKAQVTGTLDGAPWPCTADSKTSLFGEDGYVTVFCRFPLPDDAGHAVGVTVLWSHAQYIGFVLAPD